MLEYRAFKCQKLCKLYNFKRDETSHGEDILHASVLNEFLTWMMWRCISVLHLDGPWDPGIFHAVAWGQATFCGGGNDICQRML